MKKTLPDFEAHVCAATEDDDARRKESTSVNVAQVTLQTTLKIEIFKFDFLEELSLFFYTDHHETCLVVTKLKRIRLTTLVKSW